jgi:pantoate--beta-alanine ligase
MSALPVVRSVAALRAELCARRRAGERVAFVPTMGALHAGHASLITAARQRHTTVVASIFVNPLQFGPNEDLSRYPRTPEQDIELLQAHGCALLFMPEVEEMYPPGSLTRVQQTGLSEVLCGRSRPGHFDGVLTVVLKLFMQVQPDTAYFGRKDYQQALVIRRMVRDFNLPLDIEVCPIHREQDGLAMSSRNRYLSAEERAVAPQLFAALRHVNTAFGSGERSAAALVERGRMFLAREKRWTLDYLEVREPETLAARDGEVQFGDVVAIAARLGPARLIDNILLGEEWPG